MFCLLIEICIMLVVEPFAILILVTCLSLVLLYVIPFTKVFFVNTITNRKITNQLN